MIVILGLLLVPFVPAQPAPQVAPAQAPARITIASIEEPGQRLVVSGRVFGPDGRTPLLGASLYVYQTDSEGIYSRPVNDSRTPRLRGYLRTDAEGRYEYATIKPASYPNTRNPAHIHYVVTAPGFAERSFEIVFDDDPLVDQVIRARAKGEGSPFSIRSLTSDGQGGWRCTQDVQMRK